MAFTGGIGWRYDTSGNLTAYDTAGTVLAKFLTGSLSIKGNLVSASATGTASVTSTSYVSTGIGVGPITPQVSTNILVMFRPVCSQTAGTVQNIVVRIMRTTGSIPAANAALGGGDVSITPSAALLAQPPDAAGTAFRMAAIAIDTGLTIGTAYRYYMAGVALSGNTILYGGGNTDMIVVEL